MLILHTDLLLYKYNHVEANRRKSFAIATAIAKLFPRVTFPAYGSGDLTADFAPVVGNLTPRFVKSPVSSPGVGHDKFIRHKGAMKP